MSLFLSFVGKKMKRVVKSDVLWTLWVCVFICDLVIPGKYNHLNSLKDAHTQKKNLPAN